MVEDISEIKKRLPLEWSYLFYDGFSDGESCQMETVLGDVTIKIMIEKDYLSCVFYRNGSVFYKNIGGSLNDFCEEIEKLAEEKW